MTAQDKQFCEGAELVVVMQAREVTTHKLQQATH